MALGFTRTNRPFHLGHLNAGLGSRGPNSPFEVGLIP